MDKNITLFFDFKPLTVNQAYITLRNGRRCKSQAYNAFKKRVLSGLMKDEIMEFSKSFDAGRHELYLDMIVYLSGFSTKDGVISKKGGDLMNFEKVITDIIFPYMGLDDAFITSANLSKNFGTKDCFIYLLTIKERARVDSRSSCLE